MDERQRIIDGLVFHYGLLQLEGSHNAVLLEEGKEPKEWRDIEECKRSGNVLPALFDDNTALLYHLQGLLDDTRDDAEQVQHLATRIGHGLVMAVKDGPDVDTREPTGEEVVAAIDALSARAGAAAAAHRSSHADRRREAELVGAPIPATPPSPSITWETLDPSLRVAFGVSADDAKTWLDAHDLDERVCDTSRLAGDLVTGHEFAAACLPAAAQMIAAYAKAHNRQIPSCQLIVLSPPGLDRARLWPTTAIWVASWPTYDDCRVWKAPVQHLLLATYAGMVGLSSLTVAHTFPSSTVKGRKKGCIPVEVGAVLEWARSHLPGGPFTDEERTAAEAVLSVAEHFRRELH